MMSLRAFAERCGKLIEQRTPFIAYRHDRGCALLILDGGERTEYTINYKYRDVGGKERRAMERTTDPKRVTELLSRGGIVAKERVVHKTPLAATVTGFRRAITKMQKDIHTRGSLCTVEYDGTSYNVSGVNIGNLLMEMGL